MNALVFVTIHHMNEALNLDPEDLLDNNDDYHIKTCETCHIEARRCKKFTIWGMAFLSIPVCDECLDNLYMLCTTSESHDVYKEIFKVYVKKEKAIKYCKRFQKVRLPSQE